jgi:hypothetical protein
MLNLVDINLIQVLAGALVYFILGAIWFTPVFGKTYDNSLGFSRPKKYKWQPIFYWMPLLSSLLVSFVIILLHLAIKPSNVTESLTIGTIVGLALLSVSLNNAVTPITPKPLIYGAVTGFYHLIGSILVSVIIGVM